MQASAICPTHGTAERARAELASSAASPRLDFVFLPFDPACDALVGGAVAALIDDQHRGWPRACRRTAPAAAGRKARLRLARNNLAAAREVIEILQDDTGELY